MLLGIRDDASINQAEVGPHLWGDGNRFLYIEKYVRDALGDRASAD